MVKVEFDVVPTLKIFKICGYAVIVLNGIQISKFLFDSFAENSRYENWEPASVGTRFCVDFFINNELVNVVRNVKVEVREA